MSPRRVVTKARGSVSHKKLMTTKFVWRCFSYKSQNMSKLLKPNSSLLLCFSISIVFVRSIISYTLNEKSWRSPLFVDPKVTRDLASSHVHPCKAMYLGHFWCFFLCGVVLVRGGINGKKHISSRVYRGWHPSYVGIVVNHYVSRVVVSKIYCYVHP